VRELQALQQIRLHRRIWSSHDGDVLFLHIQRPACGAPHSKERQPCALNSPEAAALQITQWKRTHHGKICSSYASMISLVLQECEEACGGIMSKSVVVDSDADWFCSPECQRVHENLEKIVAGLGPIGSRRFELVGQTNRGRGACHQGLCALLACSTLIVHAVRHIHADYTMLAGTDIRCKVHEL
jgi:hypothetical protein